MISPKQTFTPFDNITPEEISRAWEQQQLEELRWFKRMSLQDKILATEELCNLAEEFLERGKKRRLQSK
ncbi:MAG: hypothetical protein JJU05_02450 [Verrucomicrobia bacterium]|nr:hypothetical protein [Verrucomicrobiota bacterium]MCH8526909.1 hypothetical protein [Kiritimatiellia bacterium]